jgi:hypothetical protein
MAAAPASPPATAATFSNRAAFNVGVSTAGGKVMGGGGFGLAW